MPTREIDLTPSEGARRAAEQGLDYRRKYGRGGTPVGIARARDIKNGKTLSPSTVRRMKAFFDRHEGNRVPPGQKKESDGGPTNGWIAWLLWGGDAGRTWAEAKVRQLNAQEDRVRIKRSFSEEEKKALKLAFKAIEKMMEDEEEREEEEMPEERPYDEEGNKIEKQEEEEEMPRMKKKREEDKMDEEERWLQSVMMELRKSK
jgi:hypothetical protein